MRTPFIATILLLSLSQAACVASTVNAVPTSTALPSVINNSNNGHKVLEFQVKNLTNARIYRADRLLVAQVNQGESIPLTTIDDYLWRNHSNIYLRSLDYNRDGIQDLAVLSSITYGGSNPCYELFYYHEASQRFVRSGAPLLCNP